MPGPSITADWIAVDWGTTRLRAWAMQGTQAVAAAQSDDGMSMLARDEFEPALLRLVAGWLGAASPQRPVTAVVCGMAGARQGWVEAPYRAVPARPVSAPPIPVPQGDPRLAGHMIGGLKQNAPADVMRGEETQIAGFLSRNPGWDGVICLPGTHTKWAQLSAGEVVSFQTFMTGEMFELIGRHSVLRHSVAASGWDAPAFAEALDDAMARPDRLAARLFSLRAGDLLGDQIPTVARARLSGLLIGAELAAARPYWLGQRLAIVGAPELAGHYRVALGRQGVPAQIADGAEMTLAGLDAVRLTLRETA